MRSILASSLIVSLLASGAASACMWDYDTLKMERQRFPDALELITGKFLRHSSAYYDWRVQDRLARIDQAPEDMRLYDDLAVAYDKLGRHDDAIATMVKVAILTETMRYETQANFGTFLVHSGRFEDGLEHLRNAVEINPDAHFGREVYQILLVEYVLTKRTEDGKIPQPLAATPPGDHIGRTSEFAKFVFEKQSVAEDDPSARKAEIERATKGVLGMMRFGHYDSAVLLEVLGDLLIADWNEDAKRLATRAYLKASYEAETDAARKAFRQKAKDAMSMQVVGGGDSTELTLAEIEKTFAKELADAKSWHAGVAANEAKWIDDGMDVDEAFTATYYREPRAIGGDASLFYWKIAGLVGIALLVVGVFVMRWKQSRMLGSLGQSPERSAE